MIGKLLRGIFFPKFLPNKNFKKFNISGWKITVLNGGAAGKPIALKRLSDEEQLFVSYQDLEKNFYLEDDYIKFANLNGFKLLKKENNFWFFGVTASVP